MARSSSIWTLVKQIWGGSAATVDPAARPAADASLVLAANQGGPAVPETDGAPLAASGLIRNALLDQDLRPGRESDGAIPQEPEGQPPETGVPGVPGVPGLPSTGSGLPGSPLLSPRFGKPLPGLSDETSRWGRDDLKRQEMGSDGEDPGTGVGTGLGHMVGLSDEDLGHRNGEKLTKGDERRFPGESMGVGSGLDHLWLLGNTEYARASNDDLEGAEFRTLARQAQAFDPLAPNAISYVAIEDVNFTGRIFDPSKAVLPVTRREITVDPGTGVASFAPDGTFLYTPAPGFSGVVHGTFSLTDPRTGLPLSGTLTIVVEAVADPASISGSAATPEDIQVATPITVTLNDHDGSEVIERVTIAGLPTGATLHWNTLLPGSLVQNPDGTFVVGGTTSEIQALLGSLSLTPPHDFHGRITLDVSVTTLEANVDPSLPGYYDRETVHFDYRVDVEAVADLVTATGDSETTPEDTRVHLDDLAATYGDLIDGSEVHTVEIRNVNAGALLLDGSGIEYPVTVAGDGRRTYSLTPDQLSDVYFMPPANESGLFDGMEIVAIATEQSNSDRQTASAPISVLVDPVADPVEITAPAQTTDEDTPVAFGSAIGIVVNDPITQTLTRVTVTDFPVGTTVTYVPVGGGAPVVVVTGPGEIISLEGGTEAQIRAALATLTLTPPLHTDANIRLSISATTTDLGVVSDTRTIAMPITVAAVADGPTIAGAGSGNEDSPFALPIAVSRIDADGSEAYEFAEITVPSGVTLTYPSTLPDGITATVSGSTIVFRPGAATTATQFERFLASDLSVAAPADSDRNFDVTVRVGTIESVLSGGEVSLLRQDQTATIPVTVHPVVDTPTISGSSTVDEDSAVNFGSNIAISQTDPTDGSEAITRVVLDDIPTTATVSYTAQGGASVVANTHGGVVSYTISGGTDADIRATLATFSLQPVLHGDANIAVSVSVTKVDRTTTEAEAASTSTVTATHDIVVAAVADGPNLAASGVGYEDSPIALPITVSRIDSDGSEQYDYAELTLPAGVTLILPGILPDGITASTTGATTTLRPGSTTTAAQFESFLATGLHVSAPADSDVNFTVGVRVGTIESVLSDSGLTLLRQSAAVTAAVTVNPVIDAPAISGSSAINEDGITNTANQSVTAPLNVGSAITISAPDSADLSEAITRIVVSGLPVGAVVSYTSVGGVATTYTVDASTTSIDFGGSGQSEAAIRAALATLTLLPPPHSDADIVLAISVTKSDATTSEGEAPASQVFVGYHAITVAAVADVPTGSGSGSGLEDQSIPVSIVVGHADTADGSEHIKNVVITGVPAGFTLTESSSGTGVLTPGAAGVYTVTGPTDAAIADVLAKLTLTYTAAGARLHLDTDFSLGVTVTTVENAPSEASPGQIALLEASTSFSVPVTVSAVVDGVTKSGASVIVEDVARTIGPDLQWSRIDADGSEVVTGVSITGFPAGATVSYTDLTGTAVSFTATGMDTIALSGPHTAATETAIRAALDTLRVTAPAHSDTNFSLSVSITTTDNDASATTQTFQHSVTVQAVADMPAVTADAISLAEDGTASLVIRPARSADSDDSETLSLRITVPSDGSGAVGTLTGSPTGGVTFSAVGGGVYSVTATGATAAAREAALDAFLDRGITFTPRANWSGVLTGAAGIRVDVVSTEAATAYDDTSPSPDDELAPNDSAASGTAGDADTRIETATAYINVTVTAVNDIPVLANSSTTVQENGNSTAANDPDLVIAIGTRLGLTIADVDGSQGLSLTLTGFPTNAQAMSFASSISGVTTAVDLATGTATISGTNANDVLSVLSSLSITLADDDDRNFTVAIDGTSTDTDGVTPVTTPVSLLHTVVVQAVADIPALSVGASTKTAVNEDSGFVTYGVTTGLNDSDGSETFQSVVVQFSTPGTGARPEVQFGTTTDVTINTSVAGRVTLTGPAAAITAAMATLQVRPGADNGEDITVSVTSRSVESAPSEDNNGATAGMGGGVTGAEISVATAQIARSFTIPVTPVPEVPSITLPSPASGQEDSTFSIGAIVVDSGTADADGSEALYLEIDTTSYPSGTVFSSGGTAVGTVTSGWLRIPDSAVGSLSITPPANYSGTITLSVRGVVVDTTATDTITTNTTPSTLTVTVSPVADGIASAPATSGIEDLGVVAFGATLANTTTGIRANDNATGTGNNAATETLTRVVLDFPADTAEITYTVTAGTASGSAAVAYDATARTYTITSSIITGAADVALLSAADRLQAETDIRATLAGFQATIGPAQTDLNGLVAVTVTTLDVNGGIANTRDSSFDHTIRIQAVADTPGLTVVDPASVVEDGTNILLTIRVADSVDVDNSESLSVRITVPQDALGPVGTIVGTPPSGVTLTDQGNGVYLVTATGATNAARLALLESLLDGGGIAFDPRANWSGSLTGPNGLKVEAISTEAATGVELAANSYGGADGLSATETVVDFIDIQVTASVDTPIVKGNAVGVEDTLIPIPMSITLPDKDGSESYVVRITGGVPSGARIYGASGLEILPVAGVYTLTPSDVSALAIRPPLNYSSPLQGDISLVTVTEVFDTSGGTTVSAQFTNTIVVEVSGVADQPGTRTVVVNADEDEPIALGSAILASAGGSLSNLLVDSDGSESLSFVVGGLPAGIIPTSSVPGGLIYIGNGTWSVTAAAMPSLEFPAVPNFSGENPYSGVTVRAVTQELDGDQATSAQWPVTISVSPVINAGTVDGFASWALGVSVTEQQNEVSSTGVSLGNVANHTFVDDDGSESVISYTFDLSNIIADAGIATTLAALPGAGSGLDKLAANYISGTFSYDSATGTITATAADIGAIVLDARLFLDSNKDFTIPVSALVRDTATLGGTSVSVDKIEHGSFAVDLVGTADVPTAHATSVSGYSGSQIAVDLGGESTDTDAALGRTGSEDVYYVVALLNPATSPLLGFTDGTGRPVGLDNGDGTWVFTAAELSGLHVFSPHGGEGVAELRLTTIATENDGDTASASALFDVTLTAPPDGSGPNDPPLPPVVSVGINAGNEDGSLTLMVTAGPAPGDTSDPAVAVMISDLPAGAQIFGARFNPETGRWVASAAAVNSGAVSILPPHDFSGTMHVTIEAVATNANLQRATTSPLSVPLDIDPVADGVAIGSAAAAGIEDVAIDLNIALGERDTDGSEVIGSVSYVRLDSGATLLGTYDVVTSSDADATVDGTSLVGFHRVPTADIGTLQALPAANWHGSFNVTVAATAEEPIDSTPDADNLKLEVRTFAVSVTASADPATVVAPASFSGNEDTSIALPGLSAALVDTVTDNGAEVLSVIISGVPAGSMFSSGSNNGDGSWTIPVSALTTLAITPPPHYSGTMSLTLTAITLELSNGDEAASSATFQVEVAPLADTVEILAENVSIGRSGDAGLELNVRMADDSGTDPGENAAELIRITFTGVPGGATLLAGDGGSISNPVGGTWEFLGTEAQSNAIHLELGPTATAGTYTIGLSAVTIDGASTLASPVTDTFRLIVPQVDTGTDAADTLNGAAGTQLLFGQGGDDTISGGGDDDYILAGAGADTLTGGAGRDWFDWLATDAGTGIDTITDFTAGAGGDTLDLSKLLAGFDPSVSDLADFVRVNTVGADTVVEVDSAGTGAAFQPVAVLHGVTGLDVNSLSTNGNLIT